MSKDKNRKYLSHVGSVYTKELKSYTGSPIVYILVSLFLIVCGILYFWNFYMRGQADLRAFFNLLPFLFMIFIPLITMGQFSEEQNSGTIEMLMTMPLTTVEIIAGKFFAALTLVALMLAPTLFYVLTLVLSGSPDFGPIVGGYVGAIFLGAAYSSIGLFASAMTRSQIVAALVSVASCLFFTMIDMVVQYLPGQIFSLLSFLGTAFHFQSVSRGIIDFRDLAYFATFTMFFLLMTHTTLEERK